MFNKVILGGRITSDCTQREVGGQKLTRFSIAVNRKYGGKEETLYIDCDWWGERAERVSEWLTKGKEVLVEGRLKTDKWDRDGATQTKTYVVVESIEFVGKKEE
jgi:single-strand DNA-binding protein